MLYSALQPRANFEAPAELQRAPAVDFLTRQELDVRRHAPSREGPVGGPVASLSQRPAATDTPLQALFAQCLILGLFAGNLLLGRSGSKRIPRVSAALLPVIWSVSGSLGLAVLVAVGVAVFLLIAGGGG